MIDLEQNVSTNILPGISEAKSENSQACFLRRRRNHFDTNLYEFTPTRDSALSPTKVHKERSRVENPARCPS